MARPRRRLRRDFAGDAAVQQCRRSTRALASFVEDVASVLEFARPRGKERARRTGRRSAGRALRRVGPTEAVAAARARSRAPTRSRGSLRPANRAPPLRPRRSRSLALSLRQLRRSLRLHGPLPERPRARRPRRGAFHAQEEAEAPPAPWPAARTGPLTEPRLGSTGRCCYVESGGASRWAFRRSIGAGRTPTTVG